MPNLSAIRQAIENAEKNIRQAKQLLADMEGSPTKPTNHPSSQPNQNNDRPGVVGIYDGEKMTTLDGETFPVPGNYASKSLLVVGDSLKMYEENGEKRFKQVEHVKRHKTTGLLVKKDGKFRAITPEGSYKVLTESINHFNGDVGDEVILHLPAGNLTSPYGAIETIRKKGAPATNEETVEVSGPAPTPTPTPTQTAVPPKPKNESPKPVVRGNISRKARPAAKPIRKEAKPTAARVEERAPQDPEAVVSTPIGEDELS